MGSIVSRHIRMAPRIAAVVATDPLETWTRLVARLADFGGRPKPPCPYVVDVDWEKRLHAIVGAPWPCHEISEFWALWPEVIEQLTAKGLRVGPASFGVSNDGEPELVRAVWCLTRHLKPANVVETGVARGLTSQFILEALERNQKGHLWSIDLPPLIKPELHTQIGAAVGSRFPHRWSFVRGSSRRRLRGLLSRVGQIDIFIHDSSHTERNMLFEMHHACRALKAEGVLVVDDIDLNWAFRTFEQAVPDRQFLVCQAHPLEPDRRRFDGKGLFGISYLKAARSFS